MKAKIVLLPGDGIGPEVVSEAKLVLDSVAARFEHELVFEEHSFGGAAIDAHGDSLPQTTLEACQNSDAVLLGAVGGPKWDMGPKRPEQGLLGLRKALGLFANLRPVRVHPDLASASPLKPERLSGVDILVVRELTGGLYFGQPRTRGEKDGKRYALDTLVYDEEEIRRVMRVGFQLAQQRRGLVTSVDKANVLESSRLWREVAIETHKEFPNVKLEHQLVDSAAMRLVTGARAFDVIVTENMFGDILTDEAAVLAGSLGLLPSASIGKDGPGLYEPIHGSAPDIAGQGIANPVGTILSAAMLLRHSLKLEREARAIERAVEQAISAGLRTADLGPGPKVVSTKVMGEAIRERITARA
jgi:3-isopropylmalate dehydrogenase